MPLTLTGIKGIEVKYIDFKVFDTRKIDEYSKRTKEKWGGKPLRLSSLKRKQRTGQKMMKLLLQMNLCIYVLNSDR